jgi:uncharacterized protein (DUF1778 family)
VSERKTTEIKLRVSPEEKTSWQLAAEQREVGLSQFIRDCVAESLRVEAHRRPDASLSEQAVGEAIVRLREIGAWNSGAVAALEAAPTSDAQVEDSSVAQGVPTSDVADVVTKPWMFEARSGD